MQIPNREIRRLVMEGFDLLVEGLAPFLDKIMTVKLGAVDWFETFCADKKAVAGFRTRQGDLPKKFDPVFQLKLLLDRQYGNVYEELSPHAQRLCSLLRDDRNDWYHHDDLCDPQDAFAALHRIKNCYHSVELTHRRSKLSLY